MLARYLSICVRTDVEKVFSVTFGFSFLLQTENRISLRLLTFIAVCLVSGTFSNGSWTQTCKSADLSSVFLGLPL